MNLVLINIILVKQMVKEAGFKAWGFLTKAVMRYRPNPRTS